jgi:hypothetical protein
MASLVMSAWRVSSAAASTSDVVMFLNIVSQEHEPFSGGAVFWVHNSFFFSIERKAFEAFHSHECDSFLSHLLSHRLRLAGM